MTLNKINISRNRGTYPMMIEPVRFSYTPDITVINQRQFSIHNDIYKGYVNNTNIIGEELANASPDLRAGANTTNGLYRRLKRGESFALNGVILHELYFRNLGGVLREPGENVRRLIEKYFNTYENWVEDFVSTAKASRGWAILCYEQRTNSLRNISLDTHDEGMVVLMLPLIVLDVYEHAYFIQYENQKEKYIRAFMENIHWEIVNQRMKLWGLEPK